MRTTFVLLALAANACSGGATRLDSSSMQTFQESLPAMKAELAEEERRLFAAALTRVRHEVPITCWSDAPTVWELVDGLTAQEIVDMAVEFAKQDGIETPDELIEWEAAWLNDLAAAQPALDSR